jgi:deoxyribose-phosphate aldolase
MYDSEMFARTCISPFLWYGNDVVEREIIDGYKHRVRSIVVEPHQVPFLKELEAKYGNGYTRTGMTIGYPYGALTTKMKVKLAKYAADNGIDELNTGIDISAFVSGDYERCKSELKAVVDAAGGRILVVPVSWIVKLSFEQVDRLCGMYLELGIKQIKTSAGLHHGELKAEHVQYLYQHYGDEFRIECNGRVRTREKAEIMGSAGGSTFHISSWRRMCCGENDYQWDFDTKTFGYSEYKDRL